MEKISKVTYNSNTVNNYNTANVFKFDSLTPLHRDSIIIIFDNKRQIIQTCLGKNVSECRDIPKNLGNIAMEKNKWKKRKLNRKEKVIINFVRVILTDEDYERATPIKN